MTTYQQFPHQRPRKPKFYQKKWFVPVAACCAGLLVGTVLGISGQPEPVEVVKEVPGPERIVNRDVEKEVTPSACIEYVDLSEQAFGYASDAMGILSGALTAAGNMDVASIESATEELKVLNPKLSALSPKVNAAKAECRAAQ